MADILYLSGSTDAVDAALMTKEHAVTAFAEENKVSLSKISGIGDSVNDLPFLRIPGLGMRGSPANAQAAVRSELAGLDNNIVVSASFIDGFLEFYDIAERHGISYVFADKDGVLVWRDNDSLSHKRPLSMVFRRMGMEGHPFVFILTGSSYEQNLEFIHSYRLDGSFAANQRIRQQPFIVLAENGALQVNVLTGETRENIRLINPVLLRCIKDSFQRQVLARMEKEILPRFELQWSDNASDQAERIWIPPKRTMFTINIPKTFQNGHDYRASARAEALRRLILDCMVKEAEKLGIRYSVL